MAHPIKACTITTKFGEKGASWKSGKHEGIDYAVPLGTEVIAPADGTVEAVGNAWGQSFGTNQVLLKIDKYYCLFAHMKDRNVKKGDSVTKGALLGHVGQEGNATGPHLHMEVQLGRHWTKGGGVDPSPILDK